MCTPITWLVKGVKNRNGTRAISQKFTSMTYWTQARVRQSKGTDQNDVLLRCGCASGTFIKSKATPPFAFEDEQQIILKCPSARRQGPEAKLLPFTS